MTNVFIIHGTHGCPEENWFPWLQVKLEKLGCHVSVPRFPTPEGQTLEAWFTVFEKYLEFYNVETILIGHSLGGAFALRVLEKYPTKIKSAYIVASPCGIVPSDFPGADLTDLPFVGHPFNWKVIQERASSFHVFHSDNDPYIDIKNSEETASKLGTEVILVPQAGHFNAKAGYTEFEALLDLVKKEIS
jgi:predicted alpha/beta hydrolase family esterase